MPRSQPPQPHLVAYHGTDVTSAVRLLNREPLDIAAAATNHIDGQLGFYLATEAADAEYFALRRQGTILVYSITADALRALRHGGLRRRRIPPGNVVRFAGDELFVPPAAFGVFSESVRQGSIHVRPFRR